MIFIGYLEKGKMITGKYYLTLLNRLKDEMKKRVAQKVKKSALPPYSPDMAPSDYCLFLNLERWLQG